MRRVPWSAEAKGVPRDLLTCTFISSQPPIRKTTPPTKIFTFLLVALPQNTRKRDEPALQHKLDAAADDPTSWSTLPLTTPSGGWPGKLAGDSEDLRAAVRPRRGDVRVPRKVFSVRGSLVPEGWAERKTGKPSGTFRKGRHRTAAILPDRVGEQMTHAPRLWKGWAERFFYGVEWIRLTALLEKHGAPSNTCRRIAPPYLSMSPRCRAGLYVAVHACLAWPYPLKVSLCSVVLPVQGGEARCADAGEVAGVDAGVAKAAAALARRSS